MNPNQDAPAGGTTHCARCGVRFRCGALAGELGCWCQALPALTVLPDIDGCLCPACLQARVDATTAVAASGRTGA